MAKSKKKTKKKTETPKLRIPQEELDKLAGSIKLPDDYPGCYRKARLMGWRENEDE